MCESDDTVSQVRHALRGEIHTIILCVDAAATAGSPDEQLEWLAFLDASCDRVVALVDRAAALVPPADNSA